MTSRLRNSDPLAPPTGHEASDGTPAPPRSAAAAPAARGERYRAPARLIGGQFQIESVTPALLLTIASLLCLVLMFPPTGWWPLAYFCLTPWLVLVCTMERRRWVYLLSYALGLAFFLINVRWMAPVTFPGYLALAIFFGLSFPVCALPLRHMFRRHGASMALVLPITWTAVEYLRSITTVGFPWFLLAHSHYRVLPLIQISDLAGAYGVTFVLAMVNGWLADLLIQPILIWRREQPERTKRLPLGSFATLVVVAGTLLYGSMRQEGGPAPVTATPPQADGIESTAVKDDRPADTAERGPVVAIVQHDFPSFVDLERTRRSPAALIFSAYMELVRQAAADRPDLIVLPETPWPGYFNDEFLSADEADLEAIRTRGFSGWSPADLQYFQDWSRHTRDALHEVARRSGAAVVTGGSAIEWKPTEIPPRVERYNSAFLLPPAPDAPVQRYDKVHLVLFGEFVPFRYTRLHAVYKWLNARTPWGANGIEYSLSAGRFFMPFEFRSGPPAPPTEPAAPTAAPRVEATTTQPLRSDPSAEPSEAPLPESGPQPGSTTAPSSTEPDTRESAPAPPRRRYLAGTPICYEDTVPYVARAFVAAAGRAAARTGRKKIDLLLNISNDGWFNHSAQLEQHLAASVFRAVENRIAVARAVNTGGSAMIDPSGRIYERVVLAPQRRALLDDLEAALRRLRDAVYPAAPRSDPQAHPVDPTALAALRGALNRLGREFLYLSDRLNAFAAAVQPPTHSVAPPSDPTLAARRAALSELVSQIDDDLESVARWRRKPHTAPGFRIAAIRVDPAETLYTRWGDWFPTGCVLLAAAIFLDWLLYRLPRRWARGGPRPPPAPTGPKPPGALSALIWIAAACGSQVGCAQPLLVEPTLVETDRLERRAVHFLLGATSDEIGPWRAHAIEALQDAAPHEGRGRLRDALRDPSAGVRFATLMALGTLADRDSLDAIRSAAEDNDPNVRVAALFALHRLGEFSRTSELAELLLDHPNPPVRANAALAIGRLGEAKSVKLLHRALHDREELVRLNVLEALVLLGDPKATKDMLYYGHSGVGQKMVLALMALGRARVRMAVELFTYRLREGPYDEVRLAAAYGLGRLGRRDGLEPAMRLLDYRSPPGPGDLDPPEQQEARMRILACSALQAIGDRRALTALGRLMEHEAEDTAVRIAAARAILGIVRDTGLAATDAAP